MKLRPRQEELVSRALEALTTRNNTLCVAPTGSGKTVMLSALVGRFLEQEEEPDETGVLVSRKALIVQHRYEIFNQNREKFHLVNPYLHSSIFNAEDKDMKGQVVFTMIQTLSRKDKLASLPSFDLVVIDEAHHMGAESYLNLMKVLRERNPHIKIVGFTATPKRGDKKGIGHFFDNVCDQIFMKELIQSGYLVPPKTFVVDLGIQGDLMDIQKNTKISDMTREALEADVYKFKVDLKTVVEKWKELGEHRKTVAFTPNIHLSKKLVQAFNEQDIPAFHLDHEFSSEDRASVLNAFETREDIKIISNAMILTEGWDCPSVGCVIILRNSSFKSLFIQMAGRGLRTAIGKQNCIILDFGISSLIHKTLEQQIQDIFLDQSSEGTGENPYVKICTDWIEKENGEGVIPGDEGCKAEILAACKTCPLCDYVLPPKPIDGRTGKLLKEYQMKEIELIENSNFSWLDLVPEKTVSIVNGFDCFAVLLNQEEDEWISLGLFPYDKKEQTRKPGSVLMKGDRLLCLAAADDFMNIHNMNVYSMKDKNWKNKPVSENQKEWLQKKGWNGIDPKNTYEAGCILQYLFSLKEISDLMKN